MSAASEPLRITVEHPRVDAVSALWDAPRGADRGAVLLAHGAGASMESPFLAEIAAGLAARGFGVLRFDYPYSERARREGRRLPPDRAPVLEATHERALACLRRRVGSARVLLAGKSMGGRMASHLAARGADAAGLVLLGYPLHPAGRPERLRVEHLPAIAVPALFLQGTRDALADLDLLRRALETYGGRAELSVVDGADHDFRVPRRGVPKALQPSRSEILAELVERIDRWERATFPA